MLSDGTVTVPPTALGYSTSYTIRCQDTLVRRYLMEGAWRGLLRERMAEMLDDYSLRKMPSVDTSHGLYACVVRELSGRYSAPVEVKGDGEVIDVGTLFSDHPMVEEQVLAYNASALSIQYVDGEMTRDVLTPDFVDAKFDRRGQMVGVRTARCVPGTTDGGRPKFILEEWDLSNGKSVWKVYENSSWVPQKEYPWVYPDTGKPFIPVVLYRAKKSSSNFWGARCNQEIVEANLEDGVAWTVHRYSTLNSSSGIPYTIDLEPIGVTSEGTDSQSKHADTASDTILQLKSTQDARAPSINVLQPTYDPEKAVDAILAATEARLQMAGMGGLGIQRKGAESGYALIVRKESVSRMRTSTEPAFMSADAEYVRKALACRAIFTADKALQPSVVTISYTPTGPDADAREAERRAKATEAREQEKHDLENGLATPASILSNRLNITLSEAQARLTAMRSAPEPQNGGASTAAGG